VPTPLCISQPLPGESDFPAALDTHLGLTHRGLEGARDVDVGRVVYVSSNDSVGFTLRASMVSIESPRQA
jgi:nucleoside-diphosphate-sugar epimerase